MDQQMPRQMWGRKVSCGPVACRSTAGRAVCSEDSGQTIDPVETRTRLQRKSAERRKPKA
jgi:hypothetical protein